LAIAVILVSKLGLVGIAIATAVPHAITTGLIIPWYTLRSVRLRTKSYLAKVILKPALCTIPFAALCLFFSKLFQKPTWGILVLEVCLSYSLFLLFAYRICLDADQRGRLSARIKGVISRKETLSEA
jgi:peptidoglycan biosynthesis protein MviN/MurJ (putative lipid II flippase)